MTATALLVKANALVFLNGFVVGRLTTPPVTERCDVLRDEHGMYVVRGWDRWKNQPARLYVRESNYGAFDFIQV